MKARLTDRRARRTDELLRQALISLLVERRYESITVQDILDRANVGRSTFYAHYYDKEDLLVSNVEWLIDHLSQQVDNEPGEILQLLPSLELFRHVQQNHHLFAALAPGQSAHVLFRKGQDYIRKVIEARIGQFVTSDQALSVPLPILSNYLAGTFVLLLWWWLENKMPYPPEQMDSLFRQLTIPGVRQVLGESYEQVSL